MDVDVALAQMRQAIEDGDWEAAAVAAESIDNWMTGGGFLPQEWTRGRPLG